MQALAWFLFVWAGLIWGETIISILIAHDGFGVAYKKSNQILILCYMSVIIGGIRTRCSACLLVSHLVLPTVCVRKMKQFV